jgi:hypothetical protein
VSESLQEIVNKVWITPKRAEWTPKTDVVASSDVQRWMASTDIEILGFTYALLSDRRIRIEPSVPLDDYVKFVKLYYERCFQWLVIIPLSLNLFVLWLRISISVLHRP